MSTLEVSIRSRGDRYVLFCTTLLASVIEFLTSELPASEYLSLLKSCFRFY